MVRWPVICSLQRPWQGQVLTSNLIIYYLQLSAGIYGRNIFGVCGGNEKLMWKSGRGKFCSPFLHGIKITGVSQLVLFRLFIHVSYGCIGELHYANEKNVI